MLYLLKTKNRVYTKSEAPLKFSNNMPYKMGLLCIKYIPVHRLVPKSSNCEMYEP